MTESDATQPSQVQPDIPLEVAPRDFHNHPRDWRNFFYVYPVLSRRSKGVSIGVNLNPDTACNFDCIYCQVDRTVTPRIRTVELDTLEHELRTMITDAANGKLFEEPEFADTPAHLRRVNDIAFSGDGEPTTCPHFSDAVRLAANLKSEANLSDVKIVLITDTCYLTRPAVQKGLAIMDDANGEIWAKLDAGTEEYYRQVNVPNYSLDHVIANIQSAAKLRPIVIQSLFMCIHETPPTQDEILAYAQRLNDITAVGGRISQVQIYTVARRPAQSFVTALSDEELASIASIVHDKTRLPTEIYGG